MCKSQSASLLALTNAIIKITGQISAFNHICAVWRFLAKDFSKTIILSISETDSCCRVDLSISSTHMLSALVFRGKFLPESIFSTPANADFSRSDSPVFAIKVPIHPTKDIKVCIPPRIGKKFFHSSDVYHVIWVAILNNCWSFVNTVYSCPACSDWDFTNFIVVCIVSGSAGFILIRGI